jgi:CheY-like chemotaxis protein
MADERPHVLVVEDDPHFADFLLNLLERQNFRVSAASAAPAALRILADGEIDLVITDVVMPDMDGIEFMRSFPPEARGLPVIAVTGSALNVGGTLSRVMRALGATQVLHKPVLAADLMAAVRGALQPKSALAACSPSVNQTA